MAQLLQRQRPLLSQRTHVGFPFDESFWNRFLDDYTLRSPFRALTTSFSTDWTPDVDISETDKEVIVEANIAGYAPKDINVEIENNVLIIRGETEKDTEEKERRYCRQERCRGSFVRQIALPNIDETKAKCGAKNGTLTITVPKKEMKEIESKAHKLVIES